MTWKNSCALLVVLLLSACAKNEVSTPGHSEESATKCQIDAPTVLQGDFYGAIQRQISGNPYNTECEGMPRPGANGVRLRFSHVATDQPSRLTLIIGIDELPRLGVGESLRTTLTIIDEENSRFFSSGDRDNCFSDISAHTAVADSADTIISGTLSCTAALPQINAEQSVRLTDLFFSGRVQWPGSSAL